jgi:WXG100 family type VII secretion target
MADLNVSYGDMDSAAKQLLAGHSDIVSRLSQLKSMIDGLVAGGYVTDASSKAFEQSYTEFNRGVTQTIQGLEGMSQFLTAAAKTFSDTDTSLAKALK